MAYEKEVYDKAITPEWFFNESVSNLGVAAVERCMAFVQSLYSDFANRLINLMEEDLTSSFILVFREVELHRKVLNCLRVLKQFTEDGFNGSFNAQNHIESINSVHGIIVKKYPKIAIDFLSADSHLSELLPDVYGFSYFNFCDQLHGLILEKKIEEFCESIFPMFRLATLCYLDLQQKLSDQQYNDQYKAQMIIEPTILFFELCGMAYCMGELTGNKAAQAQIQEQINEILDSFPSEAARWRACFELSSTIFLHSKTSMDLFEWRRLFIDTIVDGGLCPDYPDYPFSRVNWKPTPEEKRLLKMLPHGFSEFRGFDGCVVFKVFLFNERGLDEDE